MTNKQSKYLAKLVNEANSFSNAGVFFKLRKEKLIFLDRNMEELRQFENVFPYKDKIKMLRQLIDRRSEKLV